jgi:phosphoglucomutase
MAVRNDQGKMILLNGNEAASLLIKFLCEVRKEKGLSNENAYIAKTIVTSELLRSIADHYDTPCHDTLTGFKYIAELIGKLEGKTFIGGGEESYGYLIGDVVRDKDAVISTIMLCEMAAWAHSKGKTAYQLLKEIRKEHGFYKESLVSLVKKGMSGAEEIQQIMKDLRDNSPKEIAGSPVTTRIDYSSGLKHLGDGSTKETGLPRSNVLQFLLADGAKVTARPSGTEPKIKFYISVKAELQTLENHDQVAAQLDERMSELNKALGL